MIERGKKEDIQSVRLQALLDRLVISLEQWKEAQDRLEPMEQRLSQLLERGSETVERWNTTENGHVDTLDDAAPPRSQWDTLEQHFRDRAKTLDDICEAAAGSMNSIERAEARLAALESAMHARLNQLSNDIERLIPQLRAPDARVPATTTEGAEAWPLEGVMRLHEELRQSGDAPTQALQPVTADVTTALARRIESLELELRSEREHAARLPDRAERRGLRPMVAAAVALWFVAAGALAVWLNQRMEARLNEAAARVATAQRATEAALERANQRVVATQDAAGRKIDESQQTARRAEIVSGVLAAPDVTRLDLAAARAARSSGRLMWSRTRGLVFSGNRVPPAPAESVNQLWLLTDAQAVRAGLIVPDANGRVTMVSDDLLNVSRQVVGAAVTVEPARSLPARSLASVRSRALVVTPVEAEEVPAVPVPETPATPATPAAAGTPD